MSQKEYDIAPTNGELEALAKQVVAQPRSHRKVKIIMSQ
jgi:hypothetical protein